MVKLLPILLLLHPALARAERWTSPDGFLSVEAPDQAEYHVVQDTAPPILVVWMSNDESTRLGVTMRRLPAGLKLRQSSAEEGFAEELGLDARRLPTTHVSGHEVWSMQAEGPGVQFTQAIVQHENSVYKLIAVTVNEQGDTAAIGRFIESLALAEPPAKEDRSAPQTPTGRRGPRDVQGDPEPLNESDAPFDLHSLSKKIGGAAGLLGIGLLIYLLARKARERE